MGILDWLRARREKTELEYWRSVHLAPWARINRNRVNQVMARRAPRYLVKVEGPGRHARRVASALKRKARAA
jgi:hypothetical protein